jgi:hypothetical protein
MAFWKNFKCGVILLSALVSAAAVTPLLSTVSLANTPAPAAPAASPRFLDQLKLSDAQKTKIRGIRAARTRKINETLKPEQRAKLQAELKSGKKLGESLKSLNLSTEQKKTIVGAVQKANEEIKATLDNKQKKQLEAYLKQRQGAPVD